MCVQTENVKYDDTERMNKRARVHFSHLITLVLNSNHFIFSLRKRNMKYKLKTIVASSKVMENISEARIHLQLFARIEKKDVMVLCFLWNEI